MTTLPIISTAELHAVTDLVESNKKTAAEAIALDWLVAKDIENAGKLAESARKNAGRLLMSLIGHGGRVTVNKGGFKTYVLNVSNCTGQPRPLDAMAKLIEDGVITKAQADAAIEATRGDDFRRIGLKADKT